MQFPLRRFSLLFIPISFFSLAGLTLGSRSRGFKLWAYLLLMAASTGLSLAIEFLQIWFPPRTVSLNDVLAESLGGVVGIILTATWRFLFAWNSRLSAPYLNRSSLITFSRRKSPVLRK